jgi:hypothetical protein
MKDDPAWRVLLAQADAAKRGRLAIWTIYDRPSDHPDGFIARMHEVAAGRSDPTSNALTGTLSAIREIFLSAGLTQLNRQAGDEPQIVENWI